MTSPSPDIARSDELALTVQGLVAGYTPEVDILRGVQLEVARGEIVTVLGPNGAGKSTLIKTIAGLVPVRSGDVQLFGQSLVGEAAHRMVGRGLAYVPPRTWRACTSSFRAWPSAAGRPPAPCRAASGRWWRWPAR